MSVASRVGLSLKKNSKSKKITNKVTKKIKIGDVHQPTRDCGSSRLQGLNKKINLKKKNLNKINLPGFLLTTQQLQLLSAGPLDFQKKKKKKRQYFLDTGTLTGRVPAVRA
jgi:hypothetical protein